MDGRYLAETADCDIGTSNAVHPTLAVPAVLPAGRYLPFRTVYAVKLAPPHNLLED